MSVIPLIYETLKSTTIIKLPRILTINILTIENIDHIQIVMSGSGRRSIYRKSVTNDFLNSFPELDDPNEVIARVIGSRGTNIFEIEVVIIDSLDNKTDKGVYHNDLALMPSKFKKLIWIKRGDFLIVTNCQQQVQVEEGVTNEDGEAVIADNTDTGTAIGSATCKVQYIITHVLTKEQILHIQSINKWPVAFDIQHYASKTAKNEAYSVEDIMSGSRNNKRIARPADIMQDHLPPEEEEDEEEVEEEEVKYDKCGNTIE